MSNIDRILKHYTKVVRASKSPLETHYAMGVVDAMKQVKTIREELQADLSSLWKNRLGSPPQAKGTMSVLRAIISRLDSIDDPQTEEESCEQKNETPSK